MSENGYATNLGRSEETQAPDLESTMEAVALWSGSLGISDYRWFNLRDNNSDGADLFSAVGLLRDDYTRKPAFGVISGARSRLTAASGFGAFEPGRNWGISRCVRSHWEVLGMRRRGTLSRPWQPRCARH